MSPMGYGQRIAWLNKETNKRKKDKNIVLFDMDGTLTEARKTFDPCLFEPLKKLSDISEIGIVTGSDIDYLKEQLSSFIYEEKLKNSIHLLPCNGTKHYKFSEKNNEYELVFDVNMKEELGPDKFKSLMVCIIEQHSAGMLYRFPLTGHFIQYRGSMINWCPIGRNAKDSERNQFIEFDNSSSPTYRSSQLSLLNHKLSIHGVNVTVKFGGDTSFDIYPIGWDKTFCLRHFKYKDIWFVGDRCGINGNDKEIYDFLKSENRSFETENPENTKVIIENKILVQI